MKKTNHEKLLKRVSRLLNRLGIDYFITGGYAVSVWGRPRATFDIDMVVNMKGVNIDDLASKLRDLSEDGYVEEETMKEAVRNEGEFNFIDPNTGIKVDFFVLGKTDWNKKQLERKIEKDVSRTKTYFISPEDLVLNKLKWYRATSSDRHLKDAESVLKISKKKIDEEYLRGWAEKLNLSDSLEKISA